MGTLVNIHPKMNPLAISPIRIVFKDSGLEIRRFMPNVPIMAMTAFPAERRKTQALEAGATVYVEKPFDVEWLIRHIQILTGGEDLG